MADLAWKGCYSENITDKGSVTGFSAAAFSTSSKSAVTVDYSDFWEPLVVCLYNFIVPPSVLDVESSFKWCLRCETLTRSNSLYSFPKGVGFGICLLPTALPIRMTLGFCLYCGDFAIVQGRLQEDLLALRFSWLQTAETDSFHMHWQFFVCWR